MERDELYRLVETSNAEIKKFAEGAHEAITGHDATLKSHTEALGELKTRLTGVEQNAVRRGSSVIEAKTLGRAITEHDSFKNWQATKCRGTVEFEIEKKTISTITSDPTLGGGMVPPDVRTDPIALQRRRLTIRNLLAPGQTAANSVTMPRQTARQNSAASVAELAQMPQSDWTMEVVSWPVRKIAHFVQTSKEVLDDAPALQSFVDAELRYGLAQKEEDLLLAGDGSGTNLLGLIPQASAYSAAFSITDETAIDRLAMAILQVNLALFAADGVVIHPTDFTKMRLTKDAQGRYLLGAPGEPAPPTVWGVPLIVTPAITAGNYLVGSFFAGAQIFDRQEVTVMLSTEASPVINGVRVDNFTQDQVTIIAEERLALVVRRGNAMVTGSLP